MGNEIEDQTDYNCNMYIYLDVANFNAIYSNGNNEIHVQVKYEITTTGGADSTVVPTEDKAKVALVNYNGGADIPCTDDSDDYPAGWKYKTTKGDYVNSFAPQAGFDIQSGGEASSESPGKSKDGDGYILRDFYLYNDTGSNDGLQVAARLTWTDPDGNPNTWNTTDTGVNNDNDPGFVSVVGVIPKVYDATNTNGTKLDQEEEGGGNLAGGGCWYQANYFFSITEARSSIKSASISMKAAGDNPGGDGQGYPCAVYKNGPAHFYYYIWNLGAAASTTVMPLNISLRYDERAHQLCISKVKVTDHDEDGEGWDCEPTITIYDNFGNSGTFHVQKNGGGESINLT